MKNKIRFEVKTAKKENLYLSQLPRKVTVTNLTKTPVKRSLQIERERDSNNHFIDK